MVELTLPDLEGRVSLYSHQEEALGKMHDGCVLMGGVGTGKTITALAYYWLHHRDKELYIFTTARKRDELDWQNDAMKFGIGAEAIFDEKGDKWCGSITVDSWNNIPKYSGIRNAFVIADEQRLVGSGKWSKMFVKIAKANPWIMLSATPGDTWLDYITLFLANGFYKNRTQFKREHVVYNSYAKFPKVDRYIGEKKLESLRRSIVVDMPYERSTRRHLKRVDVDYDKDLVNQVVKDRWHIYEQRPLKDVAEMIMVMRRVVNSDPSRVAYLIQLLQLHKKVIVFYSFDYELELLRGLGDILDEVTVAEWNGHKHEEIPRTDRWVYLVQYSAGAEAWNCVETDQMVFYSLQYSYKVFEQAQGRIDRLNTKFVNLHYHILMSKAPSDWMIWKALSNKKDFNERELQRQL